MLVDDALVSKIAALARLEFNAQEKADMIHDLNRILSFMDKINELDLSKVDPLIHFSDEINTTRPDVVSSEITREEALSNAPDQNGEYFKVPVVITKK